MILTVPATLTCCSFPTRIVVVDDNKAIIDDLAYSLNTSIDGYTDSIQALNMLANYVPHITEKIWLQPNIEDDLTDDLQRQPVLNNIKNIQTIASMPERVNDISVVIIDYQMPELDGISLLQKLKDKPFKKVLLTGHGNDAIAVQAFNSGLIDYFLRKDDLEMQAKLKEAIHSLKQQYFVDLCKNTLSLLTESNNLFSQPDVVSYFYDNIENVSEFYLLDIYGSYLLINENNNKNYLLIHSEDYINKFISRAESDHGTLEVIKAIREKKRFPYFGEEKQWWMVNANDWEAYMYPLQEINMDNGKFYVSKIGGRQVKELSCCLE